jgi:hypothetical protein
VAVKVGDRPTGDGIPLGAIVEIEWLDSCGYSGWQSRREIDRWIAEGSPLATHRSVGYLFARTAELIVIVQSEVRYGDQASVNEAMSIPLVAVLAVRHLSP